MAPKRIRRPKLWPPSYVRYLLIWPLIRAYRRKTRTRLSWRLAGSHFATVLVSVLVICAVTIVIAVIGSRLASPSHDEAAVEAWQASQMLRDAGAARPLTFDQTDAF